MREEKERGEGGEENMADNMAKLLFAHAGVMFDYVGQGISWAGARRRQRAVDV